MVLLAISGCGPRPPDGDVVVLVSLDGFRWDYMDKAATPNLDRLATRGVRAERLIPSFPTKTFPNHYTIVTGLYPAHHGIIANNMWDEGFQSRFTLSDREEVGNGRWWGGEPIWVTAQQAEMKTAVLFWPGSEAPIKGMRPTQWANYDSEVSNEERVMRVLGWLDLPEADRPTFVATYLSLVDDAGHRYGPNAPETALAIEEADRILGLLMEGIAAAPLEDRVNIIVVSDHGMTELSGEKVVVLDEYVDLSRINVVDWAPVLALAPDPDYLDEAFANLQGIEGIEVFRKENLPTRYHYDGSDRITTLVGVMDEGWSGVSSDFLQSQPTAFEGATHGFANDVESMHALFVAAGPAFRSGMVVEPFENVHIYNLMAAILGLDPAPNDGNLETVRHMLQ